MRLRFVVFIALRYLRATRKDRKMAFSVFSIVGISVGVMTLIVVLSVMNGFQLSFIRPTLEIRSYHLRIDAQQGRFLPEGVIREIADIGQIDAVVPFTEAQAIIGLERACTVRGLDLPAAETDGGFLSSFHPEYDVPGRANLSEPDTVVLGVELASQLGRFTGDFVELATLSGGDVFSPSERRLRVTGVFKTGFYDIDLNWAFVSRETAELLNDGGGLAYGIKLKNRFRVAAAGAELSKIDALDGWRVETWREYNRVFFGALSTEKNTMGLLIGLIFLVVGFNIHHSLRRSVNERLEEIATLKAIGSPTASVRGIFVLEGVIVGLAGAFVGTLLGLLLASNINGLFHVIETAANDWLFPLVEGITGLSPAPIAIFSPSVFYISSVPVHVYLHEILIIDFFALASASFSAYFASGGVARAKPSVLLRYE